MNASVRHLLAISALVLLASAAVPLRAAPVVIDDFSENLTPSTSYAIYHDGTMLGGEVDIILGLLDAATVEIAGGILTLSGVTETSGPNNAQLIYDGNDNDSTLSYGLPSVDFTGGGSNDHFALDLPSVTGSIDVAVRVFESSGHYSVLRIDGVTNAGVLEFPFADFEHIGDGADFAAAKQVSLFVYLDTGDGFSIDSFMATGQEPPVDPGTVVPPADPDTVRPALQFQNAKRLKTPRPRHTIKGRATDNVAVAKVEVKSRLQKGWRKAKLRPNGNFAFTTKRLKSGRNVHQFRAIDTSGNRSKVRVARPIGQ